MKSINDCLKTVKCKRCGREYKSYMTIPYGYCDRVDCSKHLKRLETRRQYNNLK